MGAKLLVQIEAVYHRDLGSIGTVIAILIAKA